VIVDLLAAAGSSATQYTMVAGSEESDEFPGSYFYGYSSTIGSLTPATFRDLAISSIYTFDTQDFTFDLASSASGKGFWDRIEFIRNGALENVIYSAQCTYTSAVNSWVSSSVGWNPTSGATYTVRIYW